jgi:GNAT superfamily N-acetyltransferase
MTVAVQRLTESARPKLADHFLKLGPEDIRLRFGATLAPEAIRSYVEGIDFASDAVFGVHDEELDLVGVAHVAFRADDAELGVSVLPDHRAKGVGGALLDRAVDHARNRFVTRVYMHCLAENAAMMHIAREAGMTICVEKGEADAFVDVPRGDAASIAGEFVEQRLALFDYALKTHAAALKSIATTLGGEQDKSAGGDR